MGAPAAKVDLLGLLPDELARFLSALGEPSYRARQLLSWLHRGAGFDDMTSLPTPLRARLADLATPGTLHSHTQETAPDRATKFAFRAPDDHIIETVLIPHGRRTTLCVSSQIGSSWTQPQAH
jgi:23S rRNA (adenine2503-C2)-methyltransferase